MLNENEPDMMENMTLYAVTESPELNELLQTADKLKKEIENSRSVVEDVWETIQEKLRMEWTYNSNAIEGNRLTLGETIFFLKEGITVNGKPFKDFLEAHNHNEAIELLFDVIKKRRPISEGLMKEINALLLRGVTHTPALNQHGQRVRKKATPGQYKKLPNHVLLKDGSIHYYTEPLKVPDEIQALFAWLDKDLENQHPIISASVAHYNMVRIHPFDDGNGRGARILMNLILVSQGFPPAVIKMEKRSDYLDALGRADQGELDTFTMFIAQSLIETQEMIVAEIKRGMEKHSKSQE